MGALSGHPNIVAVVDVGIPVEGEPYLVMPYLARGSLADAMATKGSLPWTEAARIGIKIAGALESAHRLGILHRDVKPGNILLSDFGEPQLADFGLARRLGCVRDHEPAHHGVGVARRAGDPRRQGTEQCRRRLFAGIDAVCTRRRRPGVHRRRRGVVGRALRADRLVARTRTGRVGGAAIVLRGAGLGDVEAAPGTTDDGGGVRPHAAGRRAG